MPFLQPAALPSRLVGTLSRENNNSFHHFRAERRLLSPMTSQTLLWHNRRRMKPSPALAVKMTQTWWRTTASTLLLWAITRHSVRVRERVSTCESEGKWNSAGYFYIKIFYWQSPHSYGGAILRAKLTKWKKERGLLHWHVPTQVT